MKATDYIVETLIANGVTDVFGYPGGVICHFMDSVLNSSDKIQAHTNYHEQAAAFAACGYAQASGKIGVAYATSGPGATNLVTGIANAYFDSIPVLFLTGQVDTYAAKGPLGVRQRGFQETDIVQMVEGITKYAIRINCVDDLPFYLEHALRVATEGRPGPVLLDLPADVQRAIIPQEKLCSPASSSATALDDEETCGIALKLLEAIRNAKRPCLLAGAGIRQSGQTDIFQRIAEKIQIPVVTSMPACDCLPTAHSLHHGFVGANGHRCANFVLAKSDLVISIGSRLDLKQVGHSRPDFAPNAKLIRLDIDTGEFSYRVREDEEQICVNLKNILPALSNALDNYLPIHQDWSVVCATLKEKLWTYDFDIQHKIISLLSNIIPQEALLTADCGQSELWIPLSFSFKKGQQLFLTSGLGAMGYSVPAAIGVHYGSRRPVVSFNGDGGIQMNLQELQFIAQRKLPITVVVLNNNSLGMIRQFQEANFSERYYLTTNQTGYTAPEFKKIAGAYGLHYLRIEGQKSVPTIDTLPMAPALVEVVLPPTTYLMPNFMGGRPMHDQQPLMERDLYNYLMRL